NAIKDIRHPEERPGGSRGASRRTQVADASRRNALRYSALRLPCFSIHSRGYCGVEPMSVQAIGQKVRREEDLRLLTGRGRYVDDVAAPTAARGYVLRSPHAHARIVSIDISRAR